MATFKTYNIKQILLTTLWVILGIGLIVLLVAAINKKEAKKCTAIEVHIDGVSNNFFVDENDVKAFIKNNSLGKSIIGQPINTINLKLLEAELEKSTWIKNAELFFDNNEKLQVNISEREPIARIFSVTGTTFYIDSAIKILPLSDKFSARLPVFTGFPSDKVILSAADSILLTDVKALSIAIQADSFYMAMIEQIDITAQRKFEMIPKIGNQIIQFGTATDMDNKLQRLKLFYQKIMTQAGWSKYSTINLQFKNQVVAKRKGADDVTADSLRTLQIMQLLATNAEKQASDSLQTIQQDNANNTVDSSMIQQSIQRDNDGEEREQPMNTTPQSVVPKTTTAPKAIVAKPKPVVPKPTTPVKKVVVPKPKAVLPKPIIKH